MTSNYLLHIAAMIAIFLRAKNLGIAIKLKNKRMIWKEALIIALVVSVWILVYRVNALQASPK